MKKLYLEMNSGISGDMLLSLLGQCLGDLNDINKKLSEFLNSEVCVSLQDVKVNGILCKQTALNISKVPHIHKTFKDIKKLIENSLLKADVKNNAINVFKIIAEAESEIHGCTMENVHFHEVGAVDSIIDVTGVCLMFESIKADSIISSPFKLGSGVTKSMHGVIPVPAPATLEIIKDLPFDKIHLKEELTTPTGAALVRYFSGEFTEDVRGRISRIFYATGSKKFETYPNIARLYEIQDEPLSDKKIFVLEANIDDMPGEFFSPVMKSLFEIGCLDVFFTPIFMKKNRPAYKISVICRYDKLQKAGEYLLRETSTFGVRYYEVSRDELKRDFADVEVLGEKVRFKRGFDDNFEKYSPEFEDVCELSRKMKMPVYEVYKIAMSKIYGKEI